MILAMTSPLPHNISGAGRWQDAENTSQSGSFGLFGLSGLFGCMRLTTWTGLVPDMRAIEFQERRNSFPQHAGSPLGPSPYCTSTPQGLRVPRVGLATRLSNFATNRHES